MTSIKCTNFETEAANYRKVFGADGSHLHFVLSIREVIRLSLKVLF
jgi:hypothetical protein